MRRLIGSGSSILAVLVVGTGVILMARAEPHGTTKAAAESASTASTSAHAAATTYPISPGDVSTPSLLPYTLGVPSGPSATASAAAGTAAQPATPAATAAAPPAPKTTAVAAAPVTGQALPLSFSTGSASQVITVTASSTGSTTATVQAWTSAGGGRWNRYGPAIPGHVGSQGLTTSASESKSATPIGSFTLTEAFGALSNPGTNLPYRQTTAADWWISTPGALYNTHQICSGCGYGAPDEHLRYETPFYNYAVVIDYNRFPVVQGAGSAFFLHVTDGTPTAGCVSIPQNNLVAIMQWLSPGANPRILIGVG